MTHSSPSIAPRFNTDTTLRVRKTPQRAGLPGRSPAPDPPPRPDDISGIGDIALAGQPTGYAHLRARGTPTVGRFAAAARAAAAVLSRPTLWPRRRGRWQRAPRPVRRHARGRMRVTVVAVEPNGFVALPRLDTRGYQAPGTDVLHLAHGRAHTVASAPDGALRAVQELTTGRARVLGDAHRHQLINTGTDTAVVVRVTGP